MFSSFCVILLCPLVFRAFRGGVFEGFEMRDLTFFSYLCCVVIEIYVWCMVVAFCYGMLVVAWS